MVWSPISSVPHQYEDGNGLPFNGAVLKAYSAGTSTPISFATDSTGNTQAATITLNSLGYPEVSGNIVIPHVEVSFKLSLYPSQSAADSDTGAVWTMDNLQPFVPPSDFAKTLLDDTTASAARTTLGAAGEADINNICQGRLTLTSGTPVTTSDVTAATTLYFTPFRGNRIALYDGSAWQVVSFTEKSLTVPSTTDTVYDLFGVLSSGALTIEALAWTDDTTRATALTTQDGVLVKTGDATRRYLGSFRTTGVSGQTEDSEAKRYVRNYYNREPRKLKAVEATDSWTYTTDTFRQANASTANQLDFINCVDEDWVSAQVVAMAHNAAATVQINVGIGLDSTTVSSADLAERTDLIGDTSVRSIRANYKGYPGVGRHFLAWLEKSDASGTTTWRGDNGDPGVVQAGIMGELYG